MLLNLGSSNWRWRVYIGAAHPISLKGSDLEAAMQTDYTEFCSGGVEFVIDSGTRNAGEDVKLQSLADKQRDYEVRVVAVGHQKKNDSKTCQGWLHVMTLILDFLFCTRNGRRKRCLDGSISCLYVQPIYGGIEFCRLSRGSCVHVLVNDESRFPLSSYRSGIRESVS